MAEFGVLSLFPPLFAILLAIVTRRPMLSLFLGVWSGAVIYTGGHGIAQTFDWIVAAIIADDGFNVRILLFTLFLGSGVALIWRLGGALAIQNWAASRLESQRTTAAVTWFLGVVIFFDDYANTAIVGSTMRDISDRFRISREKLSYIVDSTAAPVATIGISSWVAYQLSMIEEGFDEVGDPAGVEVPSAFTVYLESIPYNAYALLAIVMVAIVVFSGRDYGEMLDAEHRSWTTGRVNREGAVPLQEVDEDLSPPITDRPMLRTFFLPVAALIVVTVAGALWTGYQAAELAGVGDLLALSLGGFAENVAGGADWASALIWGSFAMVVTAIVIGLAYDLFDLAEGVETVLEGFHLMLTAVTILVLAWSISTVTDELGTGDFVSAAVEGTLSPSVFPVVVLLTAAVIAFTMGSSWATMGILTPIAIPVAFDLTGDFSLAPIVVGAVFSGAIFGDHTSPISDTTVLSSTFTGADLIDHVRTQAYYATTVLLVVIVAYLLNGYLGVQPAIFLPLGVLLLIGLVYGLSEVDARRKGIEPVAQRADFEEGEAAPEPAGDSTEATD
ncbi:Na+/H+ antiporter NhaC family protein [Natrialbaceae archaeon GCM10025810]|uniref:Na+/H+ antiporter NhaC family protein n=1 Tax=Halovalidus salilacus TaxID=3075124 RepID=UPI003615F126